MKKKINDNQAACDFAAHILHDARLLPVSLLRNYAEMELNEKELIRLLRLVSLCYNGGTASLFYMGEIGMVLSVGRDNPEMILPEEEEGRT